MKTDSHQRTLEWIQSGKDGPFSSTRFDNLAGCAAAMLAGNATAGSDVLDQLRVIASNARYLQEDWSNLLTLITRVQWTHDEALENRLSDSAWMQFTALDVEHYHVELRSGFDYVAKIIAAHSAKVSQVPSKSYNDLSNWVVDNDTRAQNLLGATLAQDVAASRDFFMDTKLVRESIVHQGSSTLVFPPREGIIFQIYKPSKALTLLRELDGVMHNSNTVDFKRYAAATLLRFWRLVETICAAAFDHFSIRQIGLGDGMRSCHSGFAVLKDWATTLDKSLSISSVDAPGAANS